MIEATDFYLEPLASFQCIATAPEGGDGVPVHISAGAGHASLGGGSKFFSPGNNVESGVKHQNPNPKQLKS
jgi:hypothetical protein